MPEVLVGHCDVLVEGCSGFERGDSGAVDEDNGGGAGGGIHPLYVQNDGTRSQISSRV